MDGDGQGKRGGRDMSRVELVYFRGSEDERKLMRCAYAMLEREGSARRMFMDGTVRSAEEFEKDLFRPGSVSYTHLAQSVGDGCRRYGNGNFCPWGPRASRSDDGFGECRHGNETGHCPDRQDESRQHVDRIL